MRTFSTRAVREVRIHLDPSCDSSAQLRKFLFDHYSGVKQSFPHIPFLVRECEGVPPRIIFNYGFGREETLLLAPSRGALKTSQEILNILNEEIKR